MISFIFKEVFMKKYLYLIALLTLFTITMVKSMQEEDEFAEEKPQYIISVNQLGQHLGDIKIELFPDVAPKHVANFDSLVSTNSFDGTAFHRVIPGFMIQGGDPNSKDKPKNTWGYGDPNQKTVPAEFNKLSHKRGILSAARSQDPNSATSQFFICVADKPGLDGAYTVFGQVLEGMDVADKIVSMPRDRNDNPNDKVEMKIVKVKK
ncbi:MAG: peptidyl-prolyl cis-trans isomerase [Bacteroidota bacterium]|nr:peptidyl-prolyl cis-trans isomerase [Bacteroidota bacterium]